MGPQPRCEEPVHRRWQHLRHLGWRKSDTHYPSAGTLCCRQHQEPLGHPVRLRPAMLSDDQRRILHCIAEMMIPASTEYGVPSAADDAVFADILRSFGRDEHHVRTLLCELEGFADLDPALRQRTVAQLRDQRSEALKSLT